MAASDPNTDSSYENANDPNSSSLDLFGSFHIDEPSIPRRLQRAETILAGRTSRILLVMENFVDVLNQQAVLRTAESLGIQNVWIIDEMRSAKYKENLQNHQDQVARSIIEHEKSKRALKNRLNPDFAQDLVRLEEDESLGADENNDQTSESFISNENNQPKTEPRRIITAQCFVCNEIGHYSRSCPKRNKSKNEVLSNNHIHNNNNLKSPDTNNTNNSNDNDNVVFSPSVNQANEIKISKRAQLRAQGLKTKSAYKNTRKICVQVTKGSAQWLSVRYFENSASCVEALRKDHRTIWSTSLSQKSRLLTSKEFSSLPDRLAIVMGREIDGVSKYMLDQSDMHVYLPMRGFTESFNVSVASALVLQRLLDIDPTCIGSMSASERHSIRKEWYPKLAPHKGLIEQYLKWVSLGDSGDIKPLEDSRPRDEDRVPIMRKKLAKRLQAHGATPIQKII